MFLGWAPPFVTVERYFECANIIFNSYRTTWNGKKNFLNTYFACFSPAILSGSSSSICRFVPTQLLLLIFFSPLLSIKHFSGLVTRSIFTSIWLNLCEKFLVFIVALPCGSMISWPTEMCELCCACVVSSKATVTQILKECRRVCAHT